MIVVPTSGKIRLYSSTMAQAVSEPVYGNDYSAIMELRQHMIAVMDANHINGLAAPQVGVFKQFVIFRRSTGDIVDMINPEITQMWGRESMAFEFCVSIPPEKNGCLVPRMENVGVEYESSTLPGFTQEMLLSGPDAVVAQHQIDLLTGTFYIDRASGAARRKVLDQYKRWRNERTKYVAASNSRPLPLYRM